MDQRIRGARAAALPCWRLTLACFLSLLTVAARAADHGIALAYPIDGTRIQVDGDVSDWPAGLPRYDILEHLLAAQPVDAEDYSGEFRLGHNTAENALYLALEVKDADRGEAVVPIVLWTNDYAVVWVRFPAVDQPKVALLGFAVVPGLNHTSVDIPSGPWYSTPAKQVHFTVETFRQGSEWRCEYRIGAGSMTQGKHHLAPDQTIEFNISLWGADDLPGGRQDEGVAWVASAAPYQRDGRGEVLLVRSNVTLGRLAGQVRLWDGQPPGSAKEVRLQAEAAPQTVVHAVTDRDGNFKTESCRLGAIA